jgi:hypothetical protein
LALVDDVRIVKIHYQQANVEDDYDQQHNQQQIYQLLLLVQHILLELQERNRLKYLLDYINHWKI